MEFLAETVEMLVEDGPTLLGKVSDGIAADDAAAVARDAHALKGMISNFCAPETQAAALELERMGKSGDLSSASTALEQLRAQLDSLINELSEFIKVRS
jgi:HPt (histidine-containing phosphotransfer) domain-containing protein